tara:strand:+ start:1440 stop:3203 length:1764 start_codon:yes stop_codon:yes gene_type:complete
MTISRPLQRKLFMQRGGEPQAEMMMQPPQQMMQPPQQMIPPQQQMMPPSPEDPTEVLFQEGQKIGQGIISQIDNSQDYEELMNALRGDEMPVESRREELSGLVGKQDSQDTPESVLTLVQPTMALIEAQGGIDGLMRQVSGDVPVEGDMAQGVGSMLMAGQPTEPVQMANGGMVRKMQSGSSGDATGGIGVTGGIDASGRATETLLSNQTPPKSLEEEFLKRRDLYRSVIPQETNLGQKAGIVGGLSLAMGDTTKPTSFGYDVAKAGLDAFSIANQGKESQRASEQATDLAALQSAEAIVNPTSAATKQVGVRVDQDGNTVLSKIGPNGKLISEYLYIPGTNEIIRGLNPQQLAELNAKIAEDALSRKENEKIASTTLKEIFGLEKQDALFDQALNTLINNPEVESGLGLLGQLLPDAVVDESAVALRSIGRELGIAVINSATFGALSEKELQLALSVNLPTGLNRMELIEFIKAKQKAQRKYRRILETRTDELAGRTLQEYREIQTEKRKENNRVLDLFDNEKYSEGITATLFDAGTIYEVVDEKGKITNIGRTEITKDIWVNVMSAEDRKIVIDKIDQLLADRPN